MSFVCFNTIFTPHFSFLLLYLWCAFVTNHPYTMAYGFISVCFFLYHVILAYYYVICVIMLSYYTHTTSRFVTNVLILTASGASEPTHSWATSCSHFSLLFIVSKCQVLVDCVIICLFFHFLSCFTYFAIFLCITLFSLLSYFAFFSFLAKESSFFVLFLGYLE